MTLTEKLTQRLGSRAAAVHVREKWIEDVQRIWWIRIHGQRRYALWQVWRHANKKDR